MSKRFILLLIGLLALLVATLLPSSIAKFTGQHTFISGQNVSCTECHTEQAGNLSQSAYHSNFKCTKCHNTTFSPGHKAHAASVPMCIESGCHAGVGARMNYSNEAHMPLFRSAVDQSLMYGPNEACMLCHNNYSRSLTFTSYEYINYTIFNNGTDAESKEYYYLIENVVRGPQRSYEVDIGPKTKSTHYWRNKSSISCVRCHKRIRLGNIGNDQGSQHAGDVADKSNDLGHQNASYGGATDAYCKSCHYNTTFSSYPGLNTSKVHIAIELSCTTCHNSSGPWPPANETIDKAGHYSEDFYPRVSSTISRRLVGDLCTGCHHANNHDTGTASCKPCHDSSSGKVNNLVYTEPKANEAPYWVNRSFP